MSATYENLIFTSHRSILIEVHVLLELDHIYGSSGTCQLCLSSKYWSKSFLACPFGHWTSSLAGINNWGCCAWVYCHFILGIMDVGILGMRADVINCWVLCLELSPMYPIQDLSVIASNSLRTNWQTSLASSYFIS